MGARLVCYAPLVGHLIDFDASLTYISYLAFT